MDETSHIVGAWEWMRGHVPYAGFVNNKPPLLYVYYAASQAAHRRRPARRAMADHARHGAADCARVVGVLRPPRRGVVAGLVFLVYSAAFIGHDVLSVNTEILMLLPAAWAVALMRDEARAPVGVARPRSRARWWRAAALFRPQGVLFGPPLALAAGWAAWRSRRVAAAGASVVPAPGRRLRGRARGDVGVVRATSGRPTISSTGSSPTTSAYAANPIAIARGDRARPQLPSSPFVIVTLPLWYAAWRAHVRRGARSYHAVLGTAPRRLRAAGGAGRVPLLPALLRPAVRAARVPVGARRRAMVRLPLATAGRRFVSWSVAMLRRVHGLDARAVLGPVARVPGDRSRVREESGSDCATIRARSGGTLFVWGYAPVFYYHARLPAASRFVVLAQARLTDYISGNLASVRGEQSPWRASSSRDTGTG